MDTPKTFPLPFYHLLPLTMTWVVKNNTKHPREKMMYRLLAYCMTLTSTGKQTWWGYEPPNKMMLFNYYIMAIIFPFITFSQIAYFYLHYKDMSSEFRSTVTFSVISLAMVINLKLLTSKYAPFKQIIKDFMNQFHLYYYQNECEYNKQIFTKLETISHYTVYGLGTFVSTACLLCIFGPLVENIKNRDLVVPNGTIQFRTNFYLMMSFDYVHDFNMSILYFFMNVYILIMCSCTFIFVECFTYLIVFNLIGHILILKNRIKTSFTDDLSDEGVKNKISRIIEYHAFILKSFKDFQLGCGIHISGSYFHNLVMDSLLMCLMMIADPENAMMYGMILGIFMGGLSVMSFIFEEIRIQSEDLCEVLYDIPWENMSVSNQKKIMFVLAKMQISLVFVSAGGLITGVRPLIAIIKSTFSYYVMLKSSI